MTWTVPAAALRDHTAVLGKTGSGKTSTEKLIVEQAVADGFRVCVLDTVKSDWWGITLNATGKKPGLPFKVLGGPRGHVPLHASAGKAIGQLVGSGKLPLSIIDMADFEAGGIQRFFVDFAPALMRSMRGVVFLVIEEAHELAPKERAGFGAENLAIHWAKKLATAGRSKGIRLIVATQRTQALHNAVLGSCETLIAHRLTAPADQEPVLKWLKANTDKATLAKIEASLSSQPDGTGWFCSGSARVFEQVAFPKFKTYDNTATPEGDDEEAAALMPPPVDQDELRSIIGDAVKDAEANDPKKLKAEILRLNQELSKRPVAAIDAKAVERAKAEGAAALEEERRQKRAANARWSAEVEELTDRMRALAAEIREHAPRLTPSATTPVVTGHKLLAQAVQDIAPKVRKAVQAAVTEAINGEASGPQRHVLKALAWWRDKGHEAPTRAQIAGIAGWKITSGHLKNVLGSLKTAGLVTYPTAGTVQMTDAGIAAAPEPDTGATLRDGVRGALNGPQAQVFDVLWSAPLGDVPREFVADALGWEKTSGHLKNVLGSLRTLQIIDYPAAGRVALQGWVTG